MKTANSIVDVLLEKYPLDRVEIDYTDYPQDSVEKIEPKLAIKPAIGCTHEKLDRLIDQLNIPEDDVAVGVWSENESVAKFHNAGGGLIHASLSDDISPKTVYKAAWIPPKRMRKPYVP